MRHRMATEGDLTQLADLRWDFRAEDCSELPVVSREIFVELLIVYPSDRAVPFYACLGFTGESEVMELKLRAHYDPAWSEGGGAAHS